MVCVYCVWCDDGLCRVYVDVVCVVVVVGLYGWINGKW